MNAAHPPVSASNTVRVDSRVKCSTTPDVALRKGKLAAEIASIQRKRLALDEALRRRQITLARLDASAVSYDAPRFGPARHER
jgi:hypothetical protein